MTRYELAKLAAWAETLHSRKRLQKVVFLLHTAGCPLEADFILHHQALSGLRQVFTGITTATIRLPRNSGARIVKSLEVCRNPDKTEPICSVERESKGKRSPGTPRASGPAAPSRPPRRARS
jgi:hypothetical protein